MHVLALIYALVVPFSVLAWTLMFYAELRLLREMRLKHHNSLMLGFEPRTAEPRTDFSPKLLASWKKPRLRFTNRRAAFYCFVVGVALFLVGLVAADPVFGSFAAVLGSMFSGQFSAYGWITSTEA